MVSRHTGKWLLVLLGAATFVCVHAATTVAQPFTINAFPIPTLPSAPAAITTGPDGNLWFTEEQGNKIGRITPAGVITEFSILTAASYPLGIAAGPGGNMWFAEFHGCGIGEVTPDGQVSEITLSTPDGGCRLLAAVAAGPDGNVWLTDVTPLGPGVPNQIDRISPDATALFNFNIPTINAFQYSDLLAGEITTGSDGNLWFTETAANQSVGSRPVGPSPNS